MKLPKIFKFLSKEKSGYEGYIPNFDPTYEYFKTIYPDWGDKDRQQAMETIGIVYRCVKTIADDISSLQWYLFEKTYRNKEVEINKVENRLIMGFLEKPHPVFFWSDLIYNVVSNMNLVGEGILVKVYSNGNLISLDPINPTDYVLKLNSSNYPEYWQHISKREVTIPYDSTLHFKFNNAADPYRGTSPMKAAQLAAQSTQFASEFNRNYYFNSANPSGAFILPDGVSLSETEYERLRKQITQKYTGLAKAGKALLLERGMQYVRIQSTHQELEYSKNRIEDNKEVGLVFGVPEAKLYGTSTTYASAIQAEKDYNKYTLLPIVRQLKQVLNTRFLPEFNLSTRYFLDHEQFVAEDIQFLNSATIRQVQSGIITVNEARQKLGFPISTDPEADVLHSSYLNTNFDNKQEPTDQNTTQM